MAAGAYSVDRVAGALVGLAVGDALGAGYEFGTPSEGEAKMIGGGLGGWDPGEWTDDTQMAICIAEVMATGTINLEAIGDNFLDWYASGPADVGIQTSSVLSSASSGADLPDAARWYFERNPDRSAGNGSLMRTAPVALAHLGDDGAIVSAAQEVSALTHGDPLAGEACALWCIGIDRAVREGRMDGVGEGIDLLPGSRRDYWNTKLHETYYQPPESFSKNGFVVTALQAAHAAIVQTQISSVVGPTCLHLQRALHAAVRIGGDTDTVAAIAGQLLGARWGVSAIPFAWRRILHGWPGYDTRDLVRLAVLTADWGASDSAGWPVSRNLSGYYASGYEMPAAVPLPDDPGLVVGNAKGLRKALDEYQVDAVVSLCRMGGDEVPDDVEHHDVLLDTVEGNPNLFVLIDTARGIAQLRDEGKKVFLHCVGGTSRTPTVASAYLAHRFKIGGPAALERVAEVIDVTEHYEDFKRELEFIVGSSRRERDTRR